MRPVVRVAALLGLLVAALLVPMPQSGEPEFDVRIGSQALAFDESDDGIWLSDPLEVDATIVGLSWNDKPDGLAWVRSSRDGEGWSDWIVVSIDDVHVPDPGTEEAANARPGSSPVFIGDDRFVQFRVEASELPKLEADLVSAAPKGVGISGVVDRIPLPQLPGADATTSQPTIVTRSQWGGNQCTTNSPRYNERVHVMFVHHTATPNDYSSPAEARQRVFNICTFHVQARGWRDIGYNFLIDKFGNIYEGRAGGIDRAVQGAHTGGYNSWSTGVAFLGSHQNDPPTAAAREAFRQLAAWKLDVHHVDPTATSRVNGRTFNNIAGHRDAGSTACPGDACYNLLGTFRTQARSTGGAKIFDGWPASNPIPGSQSSGYDNTAFRFSFNTNVNWTFRIRRNGSTILTRTGTASANRQQTVHWDGRAGGQNMPEGTYEVWIDAQPTSGAAPRPVREAFALGKHGDVRFTDIGGSVHESNIIKVAEAGVTRGCNPPLNDRFCPDREVTREEMAAFITRALDLTATSGKTFRDVPTGSTFANSIDRLATAGVTRGCNPPANDRFCPKDPVTRGEMAAFLRRGYGFPISGSSSFSDVPSNHRFHDAIRAIANEGVTRGCNPPANDRFCPDRTVSRAEMATFLRRAGL